MRGTKIMKCVVKAYSKERKMLSQAINWASRIAFGISITGAHFEDLPTAWHNNWLTVKTNLRKSNHLRNSFIHYYNHLFGRVGHRAIEVNIFLTTYLLNFIKINHSVYLFQDTDKTLCIRSLADKKFPF